MVVVSCWTDITDQSVLSMLTVGVHHVSATLSLEVWLMIVTICCAPDSSPTAKTNVVYIYKEGSKMVESSLYIFRTWLKPIIHFVIYT